MEEEKDMSKLEVFRHKVYDGGNYISWCRQVQAWEVGTDYDPQIGAGNVVGFLRPFLVDPGPIREGELALEAFRGPWIGRERLGQFDNWKSATATLWRGGST